MIRSVFTFLGLAICLGCFILVTNGTARPTTKRPTAPPATAPTRVLMIGDSLSTGAFGETVQQHLARKFGPANVAAYASCGSSPEHWLQDEAGFYTKCGYRESTPDRLPVLRDWVNGKPPKPTLTPKIERLVRQHRPTVVIVQLGTNWMDRNLSDTEISSFLRRFIQGASGSSVRQIVWIAPPDSSSMGARAQARVHRIIQQEAKRDGFDVIDSRQLTNYVPGKTGGDGVHYNKEASREWALRVNASLDVKLRGRMAATR